MSATATPQRTMSCDTTGEPSNNLCSSIGEESGGQLPPGISSSSSEHDNHEAGAWSSDYSNSEDEFTNNDDGVTPVSYIKVFFLLKILILNIPHGVFFFIFSYKTCAHNAIILHQTILLRALIKHTQNHMKIKINNRKLGT